MLDVINHIHDASVHLPFTRLTRLKRLSEGSRELVTNSQGPFLCNFKGLDLGDGGSDAIYMKVNLGKEILDILRGILKDEMMGQITDLRFQPHITLFSQSNLTPERRA